jgi:hypothetical protein
VAVVEDLGEVRVLREEPVARMDRVGLGDLRGRDDRRDVEVGSGRGIRPDADVFVREPDVEGVAVGLAVDRDRANAELPAGRDDPQGDLPAVGDQDLLKQGTTPKPGNGKRETGNEKSRKKRFPFTVFRFPT